MRPSAEPQFKLSWILIGIALFAGSAHAEPWISNRFAQNCAACHAPARINRPAMERRCTLTCQGCHVNPNGGGLRNSYGAWNQERWLRTFFIDKLLTNKPTPAPLPEQRYAKSEDAKPVKPPAVFNTVKASPLVGEVNESLYDKSDLAWKITAEDEARFLERVPYDDPYREERRKLVTGGGDLRYMIVSRSEALGPYARAYEGWLMDVNLGVRVRPVPQYFSLVLESAFMTPPTNRALDQAFTTEPRVQSAYAISDDLPFNSYVMYGLYRPMFGLYNTDHYSLGSTISGLTQRALYKAVGIGSAPNVPFVNVNFISPFSNLAYDQSSGTVISFGGRFVTLGASIMVSLWNTHTPGLGNAELNRNMVSFSAGFMYGRLIWNGELLSVSRESAPGVADVGTVITNQFKFRAWRENYLEFNLGSANVTTTLQEGSSSEWMFGARSFLLAGLDLEALLVNRTNRTLAETVVDQSLQVQLHLCF